MIEDVLQVARCLAEAVPDCTVDEIADILWLAATARENDELEPAGPSYGERPETRGPSATASVSREEPGDTGGTVTPAFLLTQFRRPGPAGSMVPATEVGFRSPSSARRSLSSVRSLSLFKRIRRPGRPTVDIEATVEATADADCLVVVTAPGRERGLDVALVVDRSLVMAIHQDRLAEFESLLRRTGAFRSVTRWDLVPDEEHHPGQAGVADDTAAMVRIRDGARVLHHPDRLLDPNGRRIILLATDAVAAHWHDKPVWRTLRRWAEVMPTAIVQVLPPSYWAETALGSSATFMRSRQPAGPNATAEVEIAWWAAGPETGDGADHEIPVPVVALQPQSLAAWSRAIVAGTGWVDAVWTRLPAGYSPGDSNAGLSAEDRVRAFQARASRGAQALARVLAGSGLLSMPLIRVLQARVLPETGVSELAEVLVAGLLERVPAGTDRHEYEQFQFLAGTGELLRRGTTATQEWDTFEAISEYLAENAATGKSVRALMANPRGTATVDARLEPFAALGRAVAKRLGIAIDDEPEPEPSHAKGPGPVTEPGSYLTPAQRADLISVNAPGLTALRSYLFSGEAVAFLGPGASAPLYPLWDGLIADLVDAAAGRLTEAEAATCRALARESPEAVVEIVRQQLGVPRYREVLRQVLRARSDPESGRAWTPVQELVCRCAFKAVVTTAYDPGIVDARIRVRPHALATGFTTWEDELGLDRWRTGDVFGDAELPVLFAHGQHNMPNSIVLATTEYRRAYAGKLPHVLARLMDGHLVWIGFGFGDQRIAAILREIADHTGTRLDPGGALRHVAVMPWDPDTQGSDPRILAQRAEIEFGAHVVLYPAPGGDHSALAGLLAEFTDPRFPPAGSDAPGGAEASDTAEAPSAEPGMPDPASGIVVAWVPAAEPAEHFSGRAEELARLDRWAADPQVALVGVTASGGAGKTTLVTHWVTESALARRPGLRGVFGWSFYADPSAEHWAGALLEWARRELGIVVTGTGRLAARVLALLRSVPLLLVLDGLELAQDGPAGEGFGQLLDGTLREVLTGICQLRPAGLAVLTSRFPFADLEAFDGGSARMLDLPPLTPAEGSALLAAAGGEWLTDSQRRALTLAVDGHALAVSVLAGLVAARPPAASLADLAGLQQDLAGAARTDMRVGQVLQFYAVRLTEPERYLLAAISLFTRPVDAQAVLAVASHAAFGSRLAGWTPGRVEDAVRHRLGGLATWHADGTISAHPLVRDVFRGLVMDAADTAVSTASAGMPEGQVTSRADALRVVEALELLLDAGEWQAANDMFLQRFGNGEIWQHLPAARLGQRASTAFVATPRRRDACASSLGPDRLGFHLNAVGLNAMDAGDLTTGHEYMLMAVRHYRDFGNRQGLAVCLQNLAECLGHLGQAGPAREAAAEALDCTEDGGGWQQVRNARAHLAWAAALTGDTADAERQFTAADRQQVAEDQGDHLYAQAGSWYADWLARTGRTSPARTLTERNAEISRRYGWNAEVARCDRMLGRLALAIGDTAAAGERLASAAALFRDGDYLTELAATLPDLADCALADGELDAADRHVAEAITIAAPRGLIPAHCAALAVRTRVRAAQATVRGTDLLFQGRDAADAVRRLAIRHHLPWNELDALRAHAALDRAEDVDHGWAAQADALRARLVPPDLDSDPPATVERLTAAEQAADAERSEDR